MYVCICTCIGSALCVCAYSVPVHVCVHMYRKCPMHVWSAYDVSDGGDVSHCHHGNVIELGLN